MQQIPVQISPISPPRRVVEFQRDETHRIALWPDHSLLADSSGLGWSEVYTSLATERSWNRTLQAVPHVALAYCVYRPALVQRKVDGEGGLVQAELRPRLFGVIPHDRTSHWQLMGSPDIQLIYLHRNLINRVAAEAFDLAPQDVDLCQGLGFADPLLEQLASSLLDAARQPADNGVSLYVGSIAHLMAVHLLQRHARRPPVDSSSRRHVPSQFRRLQHVQDFIESHLDQDLSIARLAAEACISAHAFAPAFTRAMGVTPHGYVIHRRIERAKSLLRDLDMPIAQIAAQTGFASQSHLATVFKRATGATPGGYRAGAVA